MLKILKSMIPVAALAAGLAGGLWMGAIPTQAKPDYSKKEKKGCTYCHVAAGKKELNDAGKYYGEHNHSLEGYTPSK
ncbi:MAG TPA: hypothetical protein VK419_11125 [Bryobacteraceae bacterium]|nr:hypothetical protein [Bryobacteraceae bacterium]